MTPEKLFELQLASRLAAHEVVMQVVIHALLERPELHGILQSCILKLRQTGSERTIPGASSEYSMLIAGEGQDAFQGLADVLQTALDSGST